MKIYSDLASIPKIENLVLTIGSFDGVHKGHQALIKAINQQAKEINGHSGLMTFHPHPRMILQPAKKDSIQLLTTMEERIDRLQQTGLQNLFIVPFSVDFANMLPEQYLQEVVVNTFSPKRLVIGYDHKFGKNRAGNINLLRKYESTYGYKVQEIGRQQMNDITYSSTNIRNLLLTGNIIEANKLLGYNYSLQGVVTHGDKRGREIGFPTANIQLLDEEKLIPQQGVYAVKTTVNDQEYNGMMNIGFRPTFHGMNKTIENHIFAFEKNIYGYTVKVEIVAKIREEQKFENSEALQQQLAKDKQVAMDCLNS